MKYCLSLTALAVLALVVAGCAPAPQEPGAEAPTPAEDLTALNALRGEFVKVHNAGDAAGLGALYLDDAVLMPPNEPAARGKPAVQAWFQSAFDQFTAELTLTSDDMAVAGNLATDRGAYAIKLTPKAGGDPMEDSGKYLVVLKKQPDGSWKFHSDIWNSGNPVPGTEE